MMENCHTVTFTAYESGVGIIKDYITFISRAKTRRGLIRAAEKSVMKRFIGISPRSLRLITVDGNIV